MKKSAVMLLLSSVMALNVYAANDTFNYASPAECTAKLVEYGDKASELAITGDEERFHGFAMMSAVLYTISEPNALAGEVCRGDACYSLVEMNCGMVPEPDATDSTKKLYWEKFKPALDDIVNMHLNKAMYKPGLSGSTSYQVQCEYPKGKPSQDKCKLVEVVPYTAKAKVTGTHV